MGTVVSDVVTFAKNDTVPCDCDRNGWRILARYGAAGTHFRKRFLSLL